jgi:hypothetical protein
VSAGNIVAGGAVVMVSSDDTPMIAGLRQSEGRLKAWAGSQSVNVGSIGGDGLMGQLAAAGMGMRQIMGLMRVGLDALRGVSAAIRGDWKGVDEALRAMPMGVGAVYGAVRDLLDELDGTAEAARNAEKAWEDFQDAAKSRGEFVKALKEARKELATLGGEIKILTAGHLPEQAFDPFVGDIFKRQAAFKVAMATIVEENRKTRAEEVAKATAENGLGLEHPTTIANLQAANDVAKLKMGELLQGRRMAEAAFGNAEIRKLTDEGAKLELTAKAYYIWQLKIGGASSEQLATLIQQYDLNKKLTEEELVRAGIGGRGDEDADRRMRQLEDEVAETYKLNEAGKTPIERFEEQRQRLRDLRDMPGGISTGAYKYALSQDMQTLAGAAMPNPNVGQAGRGAAGLSMQALAGDTSNMQTLIAQVTNTAREAVKINGYLQRLLAGEGGGLQ